MGLRTLTAALAGAALAAATTAGAQPPPDAERLALAHQIVQEIGGTEGLVRSLGSAMDAMAAQLPTADGAKAQADMAQMQAYVKERLTAYTPQLAAATEHVYARDFTAAQLRDIAAFYGTPTGRVMAAKMPEIARDSVQELRPVMLKLQRDVMAKVCSMTTCTDPQKARLAQLQAQAG